MSIKQLVNNYEMHEALMEELDIMIEAERKVLEKTSDTTQMFQAQGAIRVLRRLKTLRDIVNGRK